MDLQSHPQEFRALNVLSTAGASIFGLGYLLPMVYLIWSMRYGESGRTQSLAGHGPRMADGFHLCLR